jgi:hypothetical protein
MLQMASTLWIAWHVQDYVDVSRQRLGRPNLDLLQFYW